MPTAVASSESPALSVVIASVNGWSLLEPTLGALDAQPERPRMQVVVVDRVGGDTRERLKAHEPPVEVVAIDERLSIPALRFRGVEKARGAIVAILEDHGEVSPGWAASVLNELDRHDWGAVGGPVENGCSGLVDWAAFLCEYTPYLGPLPAGPAIDLPGNNIAYRGPHLRRHADVLKNGKWESWINERLRADGISLGASNAMTVRHIKPFRLGTFLVQRFHFARSFAGMRRSEQPALKRLVYAAGSLALPAILYLRILRTLIQKRRHVGKLVAVTPLLLVMLSVGACGEMLGYLVGPGQSLERVE